jgi:cell wall-associated NlpC family hydrolase
MTPMDAFILTLTSNLGKPYRWGGDNPLTGFDCSGLVQWALKSTGMDPPGDQTAQALYDYFRDRGNHSPKSWAGTLVFYGKDHKSISHVAVMLNQYQVIEAGGGDALTKTEQDAAAKGACVRIRHLDARKDIIAKVKPDFSRVGLL